MFSGESLDTYKRKMTELDDGEIEKYEAYLQLVSYYRAQAEPELRELLKTLKTEEMQYTPRDIYKYYENASTFRAFIEDKNCPLTRGWPRFLKGRGYLGEDITSLDYKIDHPICDQYLGAFLFSDYLDKLEQGDKRSALQSLDLACEFNLFQALIERADRCVGKIKETKDDQERVRCIDRLITDIKTLGNLYGSVGFFRSALYLLDVGNYYLNLNQSEFAQVARVFHEAAAENFYCGRELLNEPELTNNSKVIEAISMGDGLAIFGIRNWDTAERMFLEHIDTAVMSQDNLLQLAKKSIQNLLDGGRPHKVQKP